jgi:hypothetical protein
MTPERGASNSQPLTRRQLAGIWPGQPSFSPTAYTFTARAASSTIVRQSRKEN